MGCAATDTTSFDGTNCEECAPDFFGNDCTKCEVSCGIHGKCSDGIAGDGGIIVLGTFKKCNDHGELNLVTGVCTCKSGWSGVGCSVAMCASSDEYGALCEPCNCNENGICDGAG